MTTTDKAKYRQVKRLNLPEIEAEILAFWEKHEIFEKSIDIRKGNKPYVFYEGPPSVNGKPGIHHVMGRAIKDLFCRYHSLKGEQVHRKAGWDTHGLPIELAVEKTLGITKEDIGKSISVEEYNQKCREEALKYQALWGDITLKMGYWVDMDNPYVTFENEYIETLWWILKQFYDRGLLYKGYTIQPFSPAAGTGLSTHELNQPGAYRDVKDVSATAQFKVIHNEQSDLLYEKTEEGASVYFLAWTTTPWTLPSNTALAVGENITYLQVNTFNSYTFKPISVIIAKDLFSKYFNAENAALPLDSYEAGSKNIPYVIVGEMVGAALEGCRYEQLLPYAQPEDGDAFKVILGDFVTTESGTGIVHIAPSFGADDMRMAKKYGLGSLTLVDKQGRFVEAVTDFAGVPVKNYDDVPEKEYRAVDIDIVVKLKTENKLFKSEKYNHSYPHCWRTDKPIIYYPLDSWFVRTTEHKARMVELNKTINWKPAATGEGRFGNWLENLVDWNLSRSRFWGTPLPIWRTEDSSEEICIGSIDELAAKVDEAVAAGLMADNPYYEIKDGERVRKADFDLHRPYIDRIVLVSSTGEPMQREADLIDVWFDSGAMPYAQWHYPFENKEKFEENYPADFIAEGVDQTRGWFFTLHAIATMLFDQVSYKNVVSNGLLLDKNGVKMSKRLGNTVDPFEAIEKYGADANRWYMISNSQPWDNLRYDIEGVQEVQRKFFGTLFNTYSFFSLYANVDGFTYEEAEIPVSERPEIDQWVISMLHSLVKEVDALYADYEPTRATRLIQDFVNDHLSNWYVRLCRRRFWKSESNSDKLAAYQTLYQCMETVLQLMSPVAPFFSDFLYQNFNNATQKQKAESIHLTDFPVADDSLIDKALEERMEMAQTICSMVLALRKKVNINVRKPLQKILVPVLEDSKRTQLEKVEDLILSEINVKEVEYVSDTSGIVTKSIKPDFKQLGRKLGKKMKAVNMAFQQFTQADIAKIEAEGVYEVEADGEKIGINLEEVIISSEDIQGWLVNTMNGLTVALDVTITEDLKQEGFARELVSRLQRLRKDMDFELTDRIVVTFETHPSLQSVLAQFGMYVCNELLADELLLAENLTDATTIEADDVTLKVKIGKNIL
ncbi:MAG: isoleucine--tRNA ligase [Chitinophagales bacterium]